MSMNARELMLNLIRQGARFRIEDEQLWVKAKPGILTDEVRKAISEHKTELISMLETYPCERCGWGVFSQPTTCFHCRKAIAEEKAREALVAELDSRPEAVA